MKIRRATEKDLKEIVNQYLEYQKEEGKLADIDVGRWKLKKKIISRYIKKYILKQDKILLVLIEKDEIVGFLLGGFTKNNNYTTENYGTIDEIYVAPKMRGKGFSSKLKDEFVKWFKEKKKGKGIVTLYVMPKNNVARKAYKKWGFKISDLKLVKEFI